ncbi:MAG: hypothetical protein PHF12_00110 [Candidatus Omnitrophica bacterium]|nr:hypothetical protein [Candidatus Omnitrophota bacterium]
MKVIEKIKAFFKRMGSFFRRKKITAKAQPQQPAAETVEKKTPETSGQEGTKEQSS